MGEKILMYFLALMCLVYEYLGTFLPEMSSGGRIICWLFAVTFFGMAVAHSFNVSKSDLDAREREHQKLVRKYEREKVG